VLFPPAAAPTAPTAPASGAGPEYRSPFGGWFDRATVRRGPRRLLDDGGGDGRYLFSPDLVPLAAHPAVRALPPPSFARVLIQHLYRYLHFTASLEHLVVNRTVLGVAHGTLGVELPEAMRFDAYKIYCDEAYHALVAADLARQVRARTGVPPLPEGTPYFLRRLAEIQDALGPELAPLVELLFVVCSETLISATLADVPDDPRVAGAVRATIRDHALDEGRHHAYFAALLRFLWGQLDPATRRTAGRLVPELVMTFLRPDLPALRAELVGLGMTLDAAEEVLAEVYDAATVAASAQATARATVRHFADLGALDDGAVRAEFEKHRLLDGVPT
jgi:hypothetical protein